MNRSTWYGLAAFALFWFALLGAGGYVLFTPSPTAHQIRPEAVHREASRDTAGSMGHERYAALRAATRRYAAQDPEAPAALAQGRELAPVDFLNEELARAHAHYRVRRVEGGKVEFYNVS